MIGPAVVGVVVLLVANDAGPAADAFSPAKAAGLGVALSALNPKNLT